MVGHGKTRGKGVKGLRAVEVRGRRDQDRAAAEEFGEPADIGAAKHLAGALILGIARAGRDSELVGHVKGHVAENGPGLGADIAEGLRVQARQADRRAGVFQQHVEHGRGIGVEIIGAGHTAEPVEIVVQQEFLAELVIFVDRRHVQVAARKRVEVDRRGGFILAIGRDGFE